MARRVPSPFRLVRAALFAVLALMILVQVGPLCEAMAVAAVPSASAMAGCEGMPAHTPDNKMPAAACAMPCAAAIDGQLVAHAAPMPLTAIAPWPIRQTGLPGLARAPATPPPRTV